MYSLIVMRGTFEHLKQAKAAFDSVQSTNRIFDSNKSPMLIHKRGRGRDDLLTIIRYKSNT